MSTVVHTASIAANTITMPAADWRNSVNSLQPRNIANSVRIRRRTL